MLQVLCQQWKRLQGHAITERVCPPESLSPFAFMGVMIGKESTHNHIVQSYHGGDRLQASSQ